MGRKIYGFKILSPSLTIEVKVHNRCPDLIEPIFFTTYY